MELVTAAKKRLQKNARLQNGTDGVVQLEIDRINYYKPSLFHLSWTMERAVNLCLQDIKSCKLVSQVYRNLGVHFDYDGIRLLGNWPLNKVNVVGKVINTYYVNDENTRRRVSIDDGTYANGCLNFFTEKNVEVGMTVEVIGVIYREDTLNDCTVKQVWLNRQVEWWKEMLHDRKLLQQQWVLESISSFSAEVDMLREMEEKNEVINLNYPIEVVDLDFPEMKVLLSKGKIISFEEWLDTLDDTMSVLQARVIYEIASVFPKRILRFYDFYYLHPIRILLNKLLLQKFITKVIPLTDEAIYAEWSRLRLQDSKQVLLSELLHNIGVSPVPNSQDSILDLQPLTAIFNEIVQLFALYKQDVSPQLHTIKALFSAHATSVATVALVAGLVRSSQIDVYWVYSDVDKRWVCMR